MLFRSRRQHVAAQDAAEDVDEHRLHVGVAHQDLEGVANLFGVGAAAHVEEGKRILRDSGLKFSTADSMGEAAETVVANAGVAGVK